MLYQDFFFSIDFKKKEGKEDSQTYGVNIGFSVVFSADTLKDLVFTLLNKKFFRRSFCENCLTLV